MKRAGQLLTGIAEPANLRLAFFKARKGIRRGPGVLDFEENLDQRLLMLRTQILKGDATLGPYRQFKINDPKPRRITASAFSDKVLHHAIMNVCHAPFERAQIAHSYASRINKGVHRAVSQAFRYHHSDGFYLKLDVKSFFDTVDHQVLKHQLARLFKEPKLLRLFYQIIDSYEVAPGAGLPIGNLSSQYFANHYLCGLDHFIKESLRCRHYLRYMDDMVLWHTDKKWLLDAHKQILDWVHNELNGELKPLELNRNQRGLSFCGYRIYPSHISLTRRSRLRYRKKMAMNQSKWDCGEFDDAEAQRHVLALVAVTRHGEALRFRQNVLRYLERNVP